MSDLHKCSVSLFFRFIVIWFPLKAKSLCTKKNAKIGIAVMPVVLFVIYFYNFFGYRVDEEGNCDVHPRLEYMINHVSPWLTAILYSYIPVILLFFFNIGIATKLYKSKKQRKDIASSNKNAQAGSDTNWLTVMVGSISLYQPSQHFNVWLMFKQRLTLCLNNV